MPYNADEIFDIAVRIERNGRDFYRLAAEKTSNENARTLFYELSEWEGEHIESFEKMKAELPSSTKRPTVFDPDGELSTYLQAAADTHIFIKTTDVSQLITESITESLDTALKFEKDSVAYYTAMAKAVPPHLGREKIETLISEELDHISLIKEKSEQFLAKP